MTQITIHRALTLIKNAENDLHEKLREGVFVSTVKGISKIPTDKAYKTHEELIKTIQSSTDTVESKLNLISKLKVAIQQKNLEVKVNFLDKEVSVAELLAIKSTINLRISYTNAFRTQLNVARNVAHTAEQNVLQLVEKMDPASDTYAQSFASLTLLQSVEIVTSASQLSPAARLEKMQQELNFLNNEIDMLLSETNIVTLIEVDM